MTEETIFNKGQESQDQSAQQNAAADPAASQAAPDAAFADQLMKIRNEKGEPKYASVNDALIALQNAQSHIATLEQENAQYRDQVTQSKTIEDIMATLDGTNQNDQNDNSESSVSTENIKNLVEGVISQRERQMLETQNINTVASKLGEMFQDKAEEKYISMAKEKGLSVEQMNTLASVSPKAVLDMFSSYQKGTSTKNVTSSVNTDGFSQQKPAPEVKSVMYGASTKDVLAQWRNTGELVQQQFNSNK